MDADRLQRGRDRFREVMGWEAPTGTEPFAEQGVLGTVFAELWTRPGLSVRDRRLISLTCVCSAGNPMPIQQHMQAALASGDLSLEEMQEFVLHLAFYAGWPVASVAHAALRELSQARAANGDSAPTT